MKMKCIVFLGTTIIPLLAGCASEPGSHAQAIPKGYLEVFTATQKSTPFASDDPTSFDLHSGYDIDDLSGKNVLFVANHDSNMDEWPDVVTIPAGNYNIVARSTWCGQVVVPVVVQEGKRTEVHLDGNNWEPGRNVSSNQVVYLPNGQAVGWSSPIAKSHE
jgi:hypothetical protein